VEPERSKRRFVRVDLSTTEGKLKFILVVSALIIIIAAGSVGAIAATMTPGFCKSCHEMLPEYVTWEASSHSQMACTKCHIEPGIVNLLKEKMGAMKQLYQHVTKTYERPIYLPEEKAIKSEICFQCHSNNREYTIAGDIIVPHDKHIKRDVDCTKCHSGVAHAKVAERGLTAAGSFEEWTSDKGKKEMSSKYVKPEMDNCIACHFSRGVTIRCEKCHKSIKTPDNHAAINWINIHGVNARKDLKYCESCHNYGMKMVALNLDKEPVVKYARGNQFCRSCHTKKPITHSEPWMPKHGTWAKEKGFNNCFVCHNKTPGESKEGAAQTFCNKCHWFE